VHSGGDNQFYRDKKVVGVLCVFAPFNKSVILHGKSGQKPVKELSWEAYKAISQKLQNTRGLKAGDSDNFFYKCVLWFWI
jgi:hypothetical protein